MTYRPRVQPIERLRMVARSEGAGAEALVAEAVPALAAMSADPAALVTACRRLVERQPACGPLWWLSARVLAALEPGTEAWVANSEFEADGTAGLLAAALPAGATVALVGSPRQAGRALARRGDIRALVVDSLGDGGYLVSRLQREGGDACLVPESSLGAAVSRSDLVLLEADAAGPGGFVATAGSLAAAAVAHHNGTGAWVVAGVGRCLPGALWEAVLARVNKLRPEWEGAEAWNDEVDAVPWSLAGAVAGPRGISSTEEAAGRADCASVPELAY